MLYDLKLIKAYLLLCILSLAGCSLPAGTNSTSDNSNFGTIIYSQPKRLDDSTLNAMNPQIAVDSSGRVFVVWQDSNNLNFTYSTDGGSTFQSPMVILGSAGGTYPRITTDGNGNAYVLWQSSPQFLLNYATSNSSSLTFQATPISVTSALCPSQTSESPVPQADITYTTNNLFVSWAQQSSCSSPNFTYDILFNSFPLFSSTPSIQVTVLSDGSFAGSPKIAEYEANPYMVYLQTSVSDLNLSEYSISLQHTKNFPVNTKNANGLFPPLSSSIAVDGKGNSYIAWEESTSQQGGVDIYFNTLPATNSSFNSNPLNLSNNGASKGEAVGIDSSQYVYVAFFSKPAADPDAYDVFLEKSSDGGNSFTDALNVSNTKGTSTSYAPGLAISGKSAYLVWDDNTATAGNGQIFFQKITLN